MKTVEQLKYPAFRSLVNQALLRHGIDLASILNEQPLESELKPEPKHYSVFVRNSNGLYYFVFRAAQKIDGEIAPGRIEWGTKAYASRFSKSDADQVVKEIQKDCPNDIVQIEGDDIAEYHGIVFDSLNEVLYRS
jgi:hypothetical protein